MPTKNIKDKKVQTKSFLERFFEKVLTVKLERGTGVSFRQVTVQNTWLPIVGENSRRNSIIIRNLDAEPVWIGDRHQSPGKGVNGAFIINQNESLTLDNSTAEIYAGTQTVGASSVICIIEE